MKPNIILITIDAGRSDHFSCYGYSKKTTPNIDNLASDGIIFENSYTTSNTTHGGHASIFTGLYPTSNGALGENKISSDIPVLAEILSKKGYATASFQNSRHTGSVYGVDRGFKESNLLWDSSLISRGFNFGLKTLGYRDSGAKRRSNRYHDGFNRTREMKVCSFLYICMIVTHFTMLLTHTNTCF